MKNLTLTLVALLPVAWAVRGRTKKCDCARHASFLQAPQFGLLGSEKETGFQSNSAKEALYESEHGYDEEADWTYGGVKAGDIWKPAANDVQKITHASDITAAEGDRYQDVYYNPTRQSIGGYEAIGEHTTGEEKDIYSMDGECDCLLRYATRSRSELLHMDPNALFTLLNTTDVEVESFKKSYTSLNASCTVELNGLEAEWDHLTYAFNNTEIAAMAVKQGGVDEAVFQKTAAVMALKAQSETLIKNLTSNRLAIENENNLLSQIAKGLPVCKQVCDWTKKVTKAGQPWTTDMPEADRIGWSEMLAIRWVCVRDSTDQEMPAACTPKLFNDAADTCNAHTAHIDECVENATKTSLVQTGSLRGMPINNEGGFHNFLRNTILSIESAQRELTYWRAQYETTATNCSLWKRFYKDRIISLKARIATVRSKSDIESFDPLSDVEAKLESLRSGSAAGVEQLTKDVDASAVALQKLQDEMKKTKG